MKSVSAKNVLSKFTLKNVVSCAARLDFSAGEHLLLILALLVIRLAYSRFELQEYFLLSLHLSGPLYFRIEAASIRILSCKQ